MAGIFGYTREAIRVKVKKCEGVLQPEYRKFSVDPQITSFEVLQSILAKAFDIKGDFTVCYRTFDDYGQETYLSLLSDWDLDAAFLSASEPNLSLQVDMKPFEESSEEWDLIGSIDVPRTQVPESKPQNRIPGIIMNQMERTLNMVQRALNLVEDQPISNHPPRPPLTDAEFRKFLDPIGQVVQYRELRNVIYLGGIEPSLRKVVWKHLLNVYPEGMSGKERMDYMKKKAYDYLALRDCWKDLLQNGQVTGDLAYVTGMVRKDVLRTDRHHRFYAGSDDNQNIASLFNILTTYALNHPTVSYCQGMSDLASPLLVTMGDEAHAYICFCALMRRLHSNFLLDGVTMTLKFQHLSEGLLFYDPEFYSYLKSHQADDLLFCYRWLLLEMKREFAFDDALCMLEVLWSALPQQTSPQDLPLYELQFCPEDPDSLPPVSPLVKTPRENAYTKVCALRRQSSSVSLHSLSGGANQRTGSVFSHRQIQSLDETGVRRPLPGHVKPFASLDDTSIQLLSLPRPEAPHSRSSSPFEVVNASEVNIATDNAYNQMNKKTSASTENLESQKNPRGKFSSLDKISSQDSEKDEALAPEKTRGRVVKNLNEFLSFKASSKNSINEDIISNGTTKSESEVDTQSYLSEGTEQDNRISLSKSTSEQSRPNSNTRPKDDQSQVVADVKGEGDLDSEVKCNDGSSPDDSTEYFPMTTSMTRELRLELENLDRQVFGANFNHKSLALEDCEDLESPVSESFRSVEVKIDSGGLPHKCDCVMSKQDSDLPSEGTNTEVAEICSDPQGKPLMFKLDKPWQLHSSPNDRGVVEPNCDSKLKKAGVVLRLNRSPKHPTPGRAKSVGEEIFIWENPLQCPTTPDEQAELEYDADGVAVNPENDVGCFTVTSAGEIFENEGQGVKSVTPIRLVRNTVGSGNCSRSQPHCPVKHTDDSYREDNALAQPTRITAFEKLVALPRHVLNKELSPGHAVKTFTNSCEEAKENLSPRNSKLASSSNNVTPKRTPLMRQTSLATNVQLPPPHEFGAGNPFLMFLCLTVLRQHRDYIMRNGMDYNEMAMHFDKMVRKHNVTRVLNQARQMYDLYKKQTLVNNNSNAGLSV